MSVSSMVAPKTVELIKVDENKQAYYKLRKNIIPTTVKNDLTNVDETIYVYDEIEIQVTYVENQIEIIMKDFNNYWTLGLNQKKEKDDLEEKKAKTQSLIDGNIYQQLDLNDSSKRQLSSVNDMVNQFIDWYFQKHPDEI